MDRTGTALALTLAFVLSHAGCTPSAPAARGGVHPIAAGSAAPTCVRPKTTLPAACPPIAPGEDVDPELRAAIAPVRHALFEHERTAVELAGSLANGPILRALNEELDAEKRQELEEQWRALEESRQIANAEIDQRDRCGHLPKAARSGPTQSAPEHYFGGEVVVFRGTEPTGYEPRPWVEVVKRTGCEWRAVSGGVSEMTPHRGPDGRRLMLNHYRVDQCNGGLSVLTFRGDALTSVGDVRYQSGDPTVCNLPKGDAVRLLTNEHGELEGLQISRASSSREEYRWGPGGELVRVK